MAFADATTTVQPATEVSDFVGGFVAAEGCFTGTPPNRYAFRVALGAVDAPVCEGLLELFGVGSIHYFARRRPHYDDEVVFAVQSLRDLVEVIVPFMDEHLPLSHKREQYLAWREQLFRYWETSARRRRSCSVEGCDEPNRAHGLCRSHLWQLRRH